MGGRSDQRSDFRLIVASNEELSRLVEHGRFRRESRAPARRNSSGGATATGATGGRTDTGDTLRVAPQNGVGARATDVAITGGAMQALQAHTWPGNVRELRHVVEASLALADGAVCADDVAALIEPATMLNSSRRRQQHQGRDLIEQLDRCAWDVSEVASELGVHRATVYRRLRRLGVGNVAGIG